MLRPTAEHETESRRPKGDSSQGKKDLADLAELDLAEEPTTTCALIGPPGSGKTAFVAGLGREGMFSSSDRIGCLPIGHATWLTVDASETLRKGESLSNAAAADRSFPFSITTRSTGVRTTTWGVDRLILRDLDCGPLFSAVDADEEEPASRLFAFDKLRDADALILFVDSVASRSDDWQVALLRILDELMDRSRPAGRHGYGRGGSIPWPRVLPYDRVLVLLSRFDLFCEGVLAGDHKAESGLLLRGLTPLGLARRVDTLAQAVERIGPTFLSALLSALGGGELAVGWVSAGGFTIDTGQPLLDAAGRPRRAAGADDLLDLWKPCGLLEAAEWIVTGRSGGLIRRVSRAELTEIASQIVASRRQETGKWSPHRAYR